MTYLRNIENMIARKSRNSITQGGKAWDNVKVKMRARHIPRGRVYERLEKLERGKWWRDMKAELDTIGKAAGHIPVE